MSIHLFDLKKKISPCPNYNSTSGANVQFLIFPRKKEKNDPIHSRVTLITERPSCSLLFAHLVQAIKTRTK